MKRSEVLAKTNLNRAGLAGLAASLAVGLAACGSQEGFGNTMTKRFDALASGRTKALTWNGLRTTSFSDSKELDQAIVIALKNDSTNPQHHFRDLAAIECAAVALNGLSDQPDMSDPSGAKLASAKQAFLDAETIASVTMQGSKVGAELRLSAASNEYQGAGNTCYNILSQQVSLRILKIPVSLKN